MDKQALPCPETNRSDYIGDVLWREWQGEQAVNNVNNILIHCDRGRSHEHAKRLGIGTRSPRKTHYSQLVSIRETGHVVSPHVIVTNTRKSTRSRAVPRWERTCESKARDQTHFYTERILRSILRILHFRTICTFTCNFILYALFTRFT